MPHHDAPPCTEEHVVDDSEFAENDSSKRKGACVGEDVPKIVETRWGGQWLAGCSMYDVDDERGEAGRPEIGKQIKSVDLHT